MSTANLHRDETADRATSISVDTVSVDLDLRGARDLSDETFATASTFVFDADGATATWIDFIGASVDEVVVNGAAQEVDWDG